MRWKNKVGLSQLWYNSAALLNVTFSLISKKMAWFTVAFNRNLRIKPNVVKSSSYDVATKETSRSIYIFHFISIL